MQVIPAVLRAARWYVGQGWPCVPVAKDSKKPLVSWKELQNRINTQEELDSMFGQNGVNLSIVTGPVSGLVVLDADSEQGQAEIESYLPDGMLTPICKTKKGKHYYFKHPGDPIKTGSFKVGHIDVRGDGGLIAAPPSEGKSWIIKPTDCTPAHIPSALLILLLQYSSSSYSYSYLKEQGSYQSSLFFGRGGRDNSIFQVAQYLRKAGCSESDACQIVVTLGKSCDPPFPERECLEKVYSTYRHGKSAQESLTADIRDWILTTSDNILTTNVYKEFNLTTRDNKKKAVVILGRLVEEGIISRIGRGKFRVVDRTENRIDWRNTDGLDAVALKWPLALQDRMEIMPGSVVVVAGESNAGKTAFLLSTASLNMKAVPTTYFASSNETNARTLRKRLQAFDMALDEWDSVEFVQRAEDFHDVIRPDGLNLIDYLEVHQDFYEIGGKLAQISQALKDGVAVVALQKNPGHDFGRGGAMTLDKATAYIGLHRGNMENSEPHTLKIQKVKYPLVDNPYLPIRFKLVMGHRFHRV